MIWPDGEVYEGEWKDDMRHGYCKHTYASGLIFEEEWYLDKKQSNDCTIF